MTPSSTEARPQRPAGVVIFHGFLAAKEWLAFYSQVIASHGFVVLAIDQAGHGASTGVRGVGPTVLQTDGIAAVRFLQNQTDLVDRDRIGLLGWSMGGGTVFSVCQLLGPNDGVKSAVAVGAGVPCVAYFLLFYLFLLI